MKLDILRSNPAQHLPGSCISRWAGMTTSTCPHLFRNIKKLGEADAECCGIRLYMERANRGARESFSGLGFEETGYEDLETLFTTRDKNRKCNA